MMTSKVARLLSGGILLLGLSTMPQVGDVASAADKLKETPCEVSEGTNAMQAEQAATRDSHVVFGEVVRVDGSTYVVKEKGGKEVSVKTDEKTEQSPIKKGDHISANVDKNNHALWIRGNRGTDRRTEHVSGDCNP
ncbi:MAG TPA: hypothetical protein VN647_01095 [Nitrospira sp.]|nr:hypothetical protein [Nitrospira sp.]